MKVHQLEVGNMQNFTYILEDEETGDAVILDPSWELDKIQQTITRNDLKIKYIVNTHHHFDHTLGNEAIAKTTGAKIVQHEASTLKHDISVINGEKLKFGLSLLYYILQDILKIAYAL
jgi:hydroxyacylglutathione hydrolase